MGKMEYEAKIKVYENKFYQIWEIPEDVKEDLGKDLQDEDLNEHQYKFFIKETCQHKNYKRQMDRDGYTAFENGLEYAKELAEDTMRDYFQTD